MQPSTTYFFYMGNNLGAADLIWLSTLNPYAGGNSFNLFAGGNYAAQPAFDMLFVLQGDPVRTGTVPEPGSLTLLGGGLASGWLALRRRRRRF